MRPVIYGYVRLAATDPEGDETEGIKRELAAHAEREGFALERVFVEHIRSIEPAFDAMVGALKSSDVKNVIVPSLWHFARLPGLQNAMRQHIEDELGARLWVVQGVQR
ncbi:recombinase family protein [Streptomyces sp. NPDC048669]|uniref:recombinase family protein n=1 Tax=Streptomyces sp. NPDC048669 TaxID=3155267 RepID=UPI00343F094F